MRTLSTLLQLFWSTTGKNIRLEYAQQIDLKNFLEGFLCAIMLIGSNYQKQTKNIDTTSQQHVKCHCDNGNCSSNGTYYRYRK
jgi:hypothetical protein